MTSSGSHDGMASSLVAELHPNEEPENSTNIEFSKRSQNPGISIDVVAVTSDATITGRATSAEQQAMTESILITEDSGVEALRCRNENTQRSSEPIEKEQKNFELGQRGASDSQDLTGEGSALTINRELGLVEGYELEVLHEPRPPNIPKADVVIVSGSGQAWEVPWTFQEKTPHPTHQAPEMPKRGVLDNNKMLPRDIGSWGRIMNFHWPWNFLADISDDEVNNFLAKTADRLLTQLRKIRKDKSESSDFLVLIGTGFGCCIIYKLIVNLHSVGPLKQTVLDEIASIVLVDSPDPRGPPSLLETFSDFYHTILERELFTASLYQELSPDEVCTFSSTPTYPFVR
ncbi:hypothetical protein QC763_116535 [Podospora pseudopauciseta]|uniref:SRR1-like domain-containing protein n=1 Tax=Podospora pseudopauciseta TaxID=2093780 RepID=A0ABR0I1B8_9PEZI|nr:hypothetical protein QC763_116535 [Podospora pseudopauciseta]